MLGLDMLTVASTENHSQIISRFDQLFRLQDNSCTILQQRLGNNSESAVEAGNDEELQINPTLPPHYTDYTTPHRQRRVSDVSTVRLFVRRQSLCGGYCSCVCHSHTRKRTPSFLQNVLGTLFISYTGMPLLRYCCNNPSCVSQTPRSLELTYCFPSWVLQRAIYLVASTAYSCGPGIGLTVRRRLEYAGENSIFQMAIVGNIEGIRELFSRRLATPNDIDMVYGESGLFVGFIFFFLFSLSILSRSAPKLLLIPARPPKVCSKRRSSRRLPSFPRRRCGSRFDRGPWRVSALLLFQPTCRVFPMLSCRLSASLT